MVRVGPPPKDDLIQYQKWIRDLCLSYRDWECNWKKRACVIGVQYPDRQLIRRSQGTVLHEGTFALQSLWHSPALRQRGVTQETISSDAHYLRRCHVHKPLRQAESFTHGHDGKTLDVESVVSGSSQKCNETARIALEVLWKRRI